MWPTRVSRPAAGALSAFALVVLTIPMWVQEGWAQEGASPSAPSSSSSVDEAAVAAFQRGTKAFGAGQFVDAAVAFEEAFELKPHAAALFNAAKAWANAGSAQRAADLFLRALDRGELGEANAADARERLAQLRQALGWVELIGDGDLRISVGNLKGVGLPAVTHLPDGTHQIACSTPDGRSFVREVVVTAGIGTRVTLAPKQYQDVQPQAPLTYSPAPPAPAAPRDPVEPLRDDDRPATRSPRKAAGFAFLGAGGVLAGTSLAFGVATLRANDDYRESDYTDADKREQVVARKRVTNGLAVSATAVGAVGVVLVTTKRKRNFAQIGIRLEPDEVGLEWMF
jgi:tetratricopeptide (TPR) repeat protein